MKRIKKKIFFLNKTKLMIVVIIDLSRPYIFLQEIQKLKIIIAIYQVLMIKVSLIDLLKYRQKV
jgi:hypothetical protein